VSERSSMQGVRANIDMRAQPFSGTCCHIRTIISWMWYTCTYHTCYLRTYTYTIKYCVLSHMDAPPRRRRARQYEDSYKRSCCNTTCTRFTSRFTSCFLQKASDHDHATTGRATVGSPQVLRVRQPLVQRQVLLALFDAVAAVPARRPGADLESRRGQILRERERATESDRERESARERERQRARASERRGGEREREREERERQKER
jgi:hypothetical protein